MNPTKSATLLLTLVMAGWAAAQPAQQSGAQPAQQSGTQPAQQSGTQPGAHAQPTDPAAVLDRLVPQLATTDPAECEAVQRELEQYALRCGRPGADGERAALCQALLARLKTDVPLVARVRLLRQLERLSGPESVDGLRALLADTEPQIRELARRCLQANGAPEAGAVLLAAVQQTQDPEWLAALLGALAARHEPAASAVAIPLVRHPDARVNLAAIEVLGGTADAEARAALLETWREGDPARRPLAATALVSAGQRLFEQGDPASAQSLFITLLRETRPGEIEIVKAALSGLAGVNPQAEHSRIRYVAEQFPDDEVKRHAIALLARLPVIEATRDLTLLLQGATTEMRVAVLDALAERGDPASRPSVDAMLDSFSAEVRAAAIRLWQVLGGPGDVAALAWWATQSPDIVQQAARTALARLKGDGVNEAIEAGFEEASPYVRAELIRALAARHSVGSVGVILPQVGHVNDFVRVAAYEALGVLAPPSEAAALVKQVLAATPEDVRRAGEDAAVAVCGRIEPPADRADPVLTHWEGAPAAAQATLVRILGRVRGPAAQARLRQALDSPAAEVREEAVRALANWPTAEVLPDLLRIATPGEGGEAGAASGSRVLALQGYIRLVGTLEEPDPNVMLGHYRRVLALVERAEEKKQALAGLAKVQAPEALEMIAESRPDEAVRGEAESAEISAAVLLSTIDRARTLEVLERVSTSGSTDQIRERAAKSLKTVREAHGFLGEWSYAGPYAEADRAYEWLHEHAFPPESRAPGEVAWRPLAYSSTERPWIFDLSRLDRENHRCVYVRTYVWADQDRPARLELGSDDALKVWLNGRLVHEYLGIRPHTPSQDKAPIQPKRGWNELLLKITQASGGWAFSCAMRGPEGEDLGPLQSRATPPEDPQQAPEPAGRPGRTTGAGANSSP